jgi:hypothetical protein
VLERRLERRRPWEGDVPNDLKIRLESLREAETTRLQRLLKRTQERFGLKPKRLAADTAYGTGKFFGWLAQAHMRLT